jgi:hypothetical protein
MLFPEADPADEPAGLALHLGGKDPSKARGVEIPGSIPERTLLITGSRCTKLKD